MRTRGHAGFSIVELIIVLAILMTVSAIAIPNLRTAMNSARNARSVADIHSISAMIYGYAAANNAQFPNSLADIECDQMKDAWGNPYQYLNLTTASAGLARVDRFNVQINVVFDLYSLGPDGLSSQKITDATSQDDIIWASDGSYIGLAELY
ncbi:MAG TPA: prepilin-type N-terminal cleavage/methylation domain-containing protein [candidate division Zixibacteria bacterium]|nr:prepilin-type N-terminal cleavage/methylation domain-containing protein [candidate division Zixibacteria bacterium]